MWVVGYGPWDVARLEDLSSGGEGAYGMGWDGMGWCGMACLIWGVGGFCAGRWFSGLVWTGLELVCQLSSNSRFLGWVISLRNLGMEWPFF